MSGKVARPWAGAARVLSHVPSTLTRGVTRRCHGALECRGAGLARSRAAAAASQRGALQDSRLAGRGGAHQSLCPQASGAGAGPVQPRGAAGGPGPPLQSRPRRTCWGQAVTWGRTSFLAGHLPPARPQVRSGGPGSPPQRGPAGEWAPGSQESEEPLAGEGWWGLRSRTLRSRGHAQTL